MSAQNAIYRNLTKNGFPPKSNYAEVERFIGECGASFILYSRLAGEIVKNDILSLGGVPLVHAHPGALPDYRRSTTIYYSMLLDNYIGCSLIILSEKIDTGDILFSKKFEVPAEIVNFDLGLDPIVRTDTLIEFFNLFKSGYDYHHNITKQNVEKCAFYIIHPVLKHMSTLRARKF